MHFGMNTLRMVREYERTLSWTDHISNTTGVLCFYKSTNLLKLGMTKQKIYSTLDTMGASPAHSSSQFIHI